MTDTWRRAPGALVLIASMGTSTCAALWNVRAHGPLAQALHEIEQER